MRKIRLDKLLSENGIPRREAGKAIRAGRLRLDGCALTDPSRTVDVDAGTFTLDGAPLRTARHLHLMVHKPAGVVTATEDGRGPTVLDLLPEPLRRRGLGPVGRLDKDVTGLVLLTTDGQLAHRLISPRWEQDKHYLATVEGRLTQQAVDRFAAGVTLSDFTAKPAVLAILEAGEESSRCEVTVTEGKYHQVKRMLAACGHPVRTLMRRSVAGIELDASLAPGGWRELTDDERRHLYGVTGLGEEDNG